MANTLFSGQLASKIGTQATFMKQMAFSVEQEIAMGNRQSIRTRAQIDNGKLLHPLKWRL